MTLESKKYSTVHGKTGSDKDAMKAKFDEQMHTIAVEYLSLIHISEPTRPY